ncbi:MAG TPA: hypothetical protein VLB76_15645 [Thermoanaerobaculia bacterium]|jgi:hypothetical protein|nr:hypothetical protein [Thermoanaerobaculia bacterium]
MNLWKVTFSGAVLLMCFFIILCKPEDRKARDWAFGAVGLMLGYWLQ